MFFSGLGCFVPSIRDQELWKISGVFASVTFALRVCVARCWKRESHWREGAVAQRGCQAIGSQRGGCSQSAVGVFRLLTLSPSFVGFMGQEILTRNSVAVEICLFFPKGGFYEQLCQERAYDPASLM